MWGAQKVRSIQKLSKNNIKDRTLESPKEAKVSIPYNSDWIKISQYTHYYHYVLYLTCMYVITIQKDINQKTLLTNGQGRTTRSISLYKDGGLSCIAITIILLLLLFFSYICKVLHVHTYTQKKLCHRAKGIHKKKKIISGCSKRLHCAGYSFLITERYKERIPKRL